VAVLMCCFIVVPAVAEGPALGDFLAHPDNAIYVRGDFYKALIVVYRDFAKILEKHKRNARSDQTEERLSHLENYDIHIEQDASSYKIHVSPTLRDHGHEVFGGAYTYVVERNTFHITGVTPEK
jgi:hypothetical protein